MGLKLFLYLDFFINPALFFVYLYGIETPVAALIWFTAPLFFVYLYGIETKNLSTILKGVFFVFCVPIWDWNHAFNKNLLTKIKVFCVPIWDWNCNYLNTKSKLLICFLCTYMGLKRLWQNLINPALTMFFVYLYGIETGGMAMSTAITKSVFCVPIWDWNISQALLYSTHLPVFCVPIWDWNATGNST